jgi:monoamine oxidase
MDNSSEITRVAIIGGGPGGLLTAYLLEHKYAAPVEITLFEASNRLGGKIVAGTFSDGCSGYEAGAAELYDYSQAGPDPLRELIDELGLGTRPMGGRAIFLGDRLLGTEDDLAEFAGAKSMQTYRAFARRARSLITPQDYYESDWQEDNNDPLARQSFEALLDSITDPVVRKYIEVCVHSDVAAEPRDTNASYGLQNFLMNEPGYMSLYTIVGGIERLPVEIARRLSARIRLNSRIERVERIDDETYELSVRHGGQTTVEEFDAVVCALPNNWIPAIDWAGPGLARAMRDHHAHYDHPAHYLRVSIRFKHPFWRETVSGSYFMLDAFGGCCVYDESSRCHETSAGVLGWLLGGDAALTLSNLDDQTLIDRVLDSLPAPLRHGRELAVEGRVHRWVGCVNALPGGFPMREPDSRHVPDPKDNPMLFVVGDYLFDSTLNGVFDSADSVAEWIKEETVEEEPAIAPPADVTISEPVSAEK